MSWNSTEHDGCIFLVQKCIFSCAFFRNQNNSLLYRANFSKSGIPVFHLFSLHIAYKWPSCDLQLTLRSYAHIWAFRELKGEHFDIGYQLVWCNLVLKQWSMMYQSEAGYWNVTIFTDVMILFEGDHWHYFGQCIYTSGQNITSKVPIES